MINADIDTIQSAKVKLSHGRSGIDEMERLIREAIENAKASNSSKRFSKCIAKLESLCPILRKASGTLVEMGQTMEQIVSVLRSWEGQ